VTQTSREFDEAIARGIAICIGFSGLLVFIYQSYIFLRYGELFLFSIIDAMEMINRFTYFAGDWVLNPKDWIGLHLILSWTPLAPVLFFSALYAGSEDFLV
jgi:hypothetical protein